MTPLGLGWAWEDYVEDFMAERSAFPIYGNMISFVSNEREEYFIPRIWNSISKSQGSKSEAKVPYGRFYRELHRNFLRSMNTLRISKNQFYQIPVITSDSLTLVLLSDTLHKFVFEDVDYFNHGNNFVKKIYSRPVDSLFRPMMFNSDNFFAEQTLLMVSNEKLGYMTDAAMIDTLLKNDFSDIPTKPRWVDGSGLSRYNLFSPKDFIYILNKLKNDFGWERIKNILPAGGQGTLSGYYENEQAAIHAKTGSMSNNVSLSGYLITKKNHEIIFSIIINNFSGSGREGRRAIEKLIRELRERY